MNNDFSLEMPNGDKLCFTHLPNEKNYAICINRANSNVYEKVGYINHKSMLYFKTTMVEWFGSI